MAGHIWRLEIECLVEKVLVKNSTEERPNTCPREHWIDKTKDNLIKSTQDTILDDSVD